MSTHKHAGRGRRLGAAVTIAVVAAATAVGGGVAPVGAAEKPFAQSTVVSALPATTTPSVTNGIVYAITSVGSQVILGGSFTTAQSAGSTTTLTRTDILAFDPATGEISTTFAPVLDGTVTSLEPGPVAGTVYAGGYFKTVSGAKSKGITLLNTTTGAVVTAFKPPILNGAVLAMATSGGRVFLGGAFTLAGTATRNGLASINATTGALDNYLAVSVVGHHNWFDGSTGANGAVGPRAMAVNPAGDTLMVIGNFTSADGLDRNQIVKINLASDAATVDPTWTTLQYSATCASQRNDTYMTDVQYSPDGSYFVVTATGTTGTNIDGTKALCDSAARWPAAGSGSNLQPTWVDWTGQDTLLSVAISGTAIYVGGHQRWLNNPTGPNVAAAGAIPRPGLGALDPLSGVPLAWNPGRNPRGAGAYAVYVNADGLYVGSDTDYIGNNKYKRPKIAYFPLAGGSSPAATTTATLPANLYLAGPSVPAATATGLGSTDDLAYRALSSSDIGPTTTVPSTGVAWGGTRGAFAVGDILFWGTPGPTATTPGAMYRASIAGGSVGPATLVDPYNDPLWANVSTGSGQTYRGVKSGYLTDLNTMTGAFYSAGSVYYTMAGKPALYVRAFSPDSGTVGGDVASITGADFSNVAGITASGDTLYFASADGALHSMAWPNRTPDPSTDTVVSNPAHDGLDWRARSLLLYGDATFPTYGGPDTPPAPVPNVSCTAQNCSLDATASSDPDGYITRYTWDFGDGSASATGASTTAPVVSHGYAAPGTYTVSVSAVDDRRVTATQTRAVTVTAPSSPVSYVGTAGANVLSATPSVTVPADTQPGDTEILVVSTGTAGVSTAPPSGSGWTQLVRRTNTLETTVWTRTAAAGDAATVTVPLTTSTRTDLALSTYRGVAATSVATSADTYLINHAAPAMPVTTGGSWVLWSWQERSSTATTWTPPSGATVRRIGNGASGGHTDTLTADSGQGVASGTTPAQWAATNVATSKGTAVSIVLTPGS